MKPSHSRLHRIGILRSAPAIPPPVLRTDLARGVFLAGTIRDLDGILGWLDDPELYHQARLETVKRGREAVERVRLLHLQWQAEFAYDDGDEIGAHAHISPSYIAQCTTIKSAYIEIACRSGGLLKCAAAAKLLLAARLSKSRSVSLLADATGKRLRLDAG